MSLLLKAFPHGRPGPRAPRALLVLTVVLSLAFVMLPLGETAQAGARHHVSHAVAHARHVEHLKAKRLKAERAKAKHAEQKAKRAAAKRAEKARRAAKRAAKAKHAAEVRARKKAARPPRVPGQPPTNYVVPQGSYFSFPNRTAHDRQAIRGRVLATVRSVWGGPRNAYGAPLPTNGTIRIATWTFDDWQMARALVAAKKRGVSVQVLVAKNANQGHASWAWLRSKLGTASFRKNVPATAPTWSWARACRGSCRGRGGTAHSKYFLFTDVGAAHVPTIAFQTSMNLTTFAVSGQWNQAQVTYSPNIYRDYATVFAQSRYNRPLPDPYRSVVFGGVHDFFFPRYQHAPGYDPVNQILKLVGCTGATAGGTGRTRINIIQYAMYGERGVWLARSLRYLWEHGCSVSILYSVASRPVLSILRNGSGRGPIPMRQSVITDGYGTIVKYNHSKWMTIVGRWHNNPAAYLAFSGSANWADLALGDDEQMQLIQDRTDVLSYLHDFAVTWSQPSSHQPGYGVLPTIEGRVIPTFARDVPASKPAWGKGIFKYMTPD